MSAWILEIASKTTLWVTERLDESVRCPMPLSDVRGQLAGLLHSRPTAALVAAVAVVFLILAVRSAWFDIYGRWYSR